MLKNLSLAVAALCLTPALSFAAPSNGSAQSFITPARVDVGVDVPGDKGRPGRPDRVTCYARNQRGMTFRADGYSARQTRRQAMNECRRYSFYSCRSLGCR